MSLCVMPESYNIFLSCSDGWRRRRAGMLHGRNRVIHRQSDAVIAGREETELEDHERNRGAVMADREETELEDHERNRGAVMADREETKLEDHERNRGAVMADREETKLEDEKHDDRDDDYDLNENI